MKDPYSVLHAKEQDLERICKEIQALLTVIPLLADDQPPDVAHDLIFAHSRTPVDRAENDMTQLEVYYPFIRNLRLSERGAR